VTQSQTCLEIHGRAISYSGDGFLEIWHIGTHHTFFVVDEKSLLSGYFPKHSHNLLHTSMMPSIASGTI
jgi:hypothetical protein